MELKDLFQKVKNLKTHYLNKKRKKEHKIDEEDNDGQERKELGVDSNETNKSMLKGDHGTIFGVSRPIVIGIVIFFVLTFLLAFYYAISEPSKTRQEETQKYEVEKIAGENSVNRTDGGKLTSDYEKLKASNQNKIQGNQQTTAQNSTGQNVQTVKAQQQSPASQAVQNTSSVSTIPRTAIAAPAGGYSVPYQLTSARQETQQEAGSKEDKNIIDRAEQELKEKYKAAISFWGDNEVATSTNSNSSVSDNSLAAHTLISSSAAVYAAPTENTILAGTTIPMMLMTGINTDSPGVVYAQVLADVYDTIGTNLMFPASSQLIGSYDSSSNGGRVPVTFSTLITPDGGSWAIGNSIVAGDGTGYIGLQGTVHHHTSSKLRQGIFNSAITALSTVAADKVTLTGDALSALAGDTSSYKDTTTIAPGYTFNAYVVNNIEF